MSFRNLAFNPGSLYPTTNNNTNATGHMNARRIDRNMVSAWERITQKNFVGYNSTTSYLAGIGANIRSANVNDVPNYNSMVNREYRDHWVTIDGVFNGNSARANLGFRWEYRTVNDALFGASDTVGYRRGETGSNNNSNVVTNTSNFRMAPMQNLNANVNNTIYWQPRHGTPFHLSFWTTEVDSFNTGTLVITQCEYMFVNNNSFAAGFHWLFYQNYNWNATNDAPRICGFNGGQEGTNTTLTFTGQVTHWAKRTAGPPLEVNIAGGGNLPLKWSQTMKIFDHSKTQ